MGWFRRMRIFFVRVSRVLWMISWLIVGGLLLVVVRVCRLLMICVVVI